MKSKFVVVISFDSHNTTFASWHIFTCHNALRLFKNSHNTKFRVVVVSLIPQRVVVVFFSLNERFRSLSVTFQQPRRLRHGHTRASNDTTQQSGQTPDKELEIKKNITVYVSCYAETDTTGMLSPPIVWSQRSEFVSSRQSGQTRAAVRVRFQRPCNGQNVWTRMSD